MAEQPDRVHEGVLNALLVAHFAALGVPEGGRVFVPLRARYAAHLVAVTGAAPQLLLTFEYDQSCHKGPSFSVGRLRCRAHYGAAYRLERAASRDVSGGLKGVCPAQESAWVMRRR